MKKSLFKIGLFGGTFDPIHFGHLNLAIELMEKKALDEVWFIPAQINPLKIQTPPTSFDSRMEMTQLAIKGIPHFHLKGIDRGKNLPSYTVDTLRLLHLEQSRRSTPSRFYLILGEDSIADFPLWQEPEEIVKLSSLLIGSRYGNPLPKLDYFSLPLKEAIEEGWTMTRCLDISATVIRERLSQKLYCGHLVPAPVLCYIKKTGLYSAY